MRNILQLEKFLTEYKKWRRWQKLVTALACVVVFVTTYALILPAITLSNETYCNHEEHKTHSQEAGCYQEKTVLSCTTQESQGQTHTDECYENISTLTCNLEESAGHTHGEGCYDEEGTLICAEKESVGHAHSTECYSESAVLVCEQEECEGHQHSEACYSSEMVLACEKEIHEHTEECFANPNADVESKETWEKSLANVKLTGYWDEDVIAIAESQLGYTESSANYKVVDGDKKGYTRYGAWYGNAYGDWCAMYVSFCLNYAQVDQNLIPYEAGCQNWINKLKDKGIFEGGEYTPKAGDLIFFDWENDGHSDHVGLVDEVQTYSDGKIRQIKTIEGNSSNRVQYVTYEPDDKNIVGYGVLPQNPAMTVEEPEEEVKEETPAVEEETPAEEEIPAVEETPAEEETPTVEKTLEVEETPAEEESLVVDNTTSDENAYVVDRIDRDHSSIEPAVEGEIEIPDEVVEIQKAPAKKQIDEVVEADIDADEISEKELTNNIGTIRPMANQEPIKLDEYIVEADGDNKTLLSYRKSNNDDWSPVTSTTVIAGDDSLRLDVAFKNIPLSDLINADGVITYTLPKMFTNVQAEGFITAGTERVGTITVEGNMVTIHLYNTFLEQQKNNNQSYVNGCFYVTASVNKTYVEEEKPSKLVVGDVQINVNFEDELVAKTEVLTLTKGVLTGLTQDKNGNYYITYRISVKADSDGAKDVKVVDTFTKNQDYICEYMGVTGDKTAISQIREISETSSYVANGQVYTANVMKNSTGIITSITPTNEKPGTLVWELGDMEPDETRYLEYKVKVEDEIVGGKLQATFSNKAEVFSKDYPRNNKICNYSPKATAGVKKSVVGEPKKQADGSYLISYKVTVTAASNNDYTLTNVSIKDRFAKIESEITAEDKINLLNKGYLEYEEETFVLKDANGNSIGVDGQTNPVINAGVTSSDGIHRNFQYFIGDLNPGEVKTLEYTVRLSAEEFAKYPEQDLVIGNNAIAYSDDTKADGAQSLGSGSTSTTMDTKEWIRKLAGEKLKADKTINTTGSDNAYSSIGAKIDNPGSFTVPAGAYEYTVIANEEGDWDISSAVIKDDFGNQNMHFVGWVKVDAFAISASETIPEDADESVKAYFENKTPAKTVWVNIDESKQFALPFNQINMDGTYAYRLTYYALPDKTPDGVVVINNKVGISGEVGIGGHKYQLGSIEANAMVVLAQSGDFAYQKLGWYYEEPKGNNYERGALYWLLKLDGTIEKGAQIVDLAFSYLDESDDMSGHFLHNDYLVGTYVGNSNASDITQYESYQTAIRAGALSQYGQGTVAEDATPDDSIYDGTSLGRFITFTRTITLPESESLYVLVKSEPADLPAYDKTYTFENHLTTAEHAYDSEYYSSDTLVVSGNKGVSKFASDMRFVYADINGGFSISQNNLLAQKNNPQEHITGNASRTLDQKILESKSKNGENVQGTYVVWVVILNTNGQLEGKNITVEDKLPDGLSLSYVSKKTGEEYPYTQNGNSIVWNVNNIQGEMIFAVACRVTSEEAIFEGKETKFMNYVRITDGSGDEIDHDTSGITVSSITLEKGDLLKPNDSTNGGGRIPFAIYVNSYAEDLIKGADTLSVIDVLSDTLRIDTASICVQDVATGVDLDPSQYKVIVDGQTVKFILPDEMYIWIMYDTIVQAAPGTPVDIKNVAHWEGYTAPEYSIVEKKNFKYSAGGSVSTSDTPILKIIKKDQNDVNQVLAGAKFKVAEVMIQNGQFEEVSNGQVWDGDQFVTDSDGKLTIGTGNTLMKWNTPYKVEEVKAPDGYVLDDVAKEPHYFVVIESGTTATQEQIALSKQGKLTIWYLGAEYTYEVFNRKGEVVVEKRFMDEGGNTQSTLDGKYTFALYKVEGSTEVPIGEPKSLTIKHGVTNTSLVFSDLELGAVYKVYEIDDSGQPIYDSNIGVVGGKMFEVVYSSVNVQVTEKNPSTDLTITNAVHYTELPQTGGFGTTKIYLAGILMMLFAGLALAIKNRFIAYL